MKKNLIILLFSLLLFSCKMGDTPKSSTLTVTIEPQRYFLEQIVGDKFEVNTLVPPGSSPEAFDPSPMAMVNLGKSKAYFKVGFLGYENVWSKKLESNNPDVKQIDCSSGIELLYGTHGEHCNHDGEHTDHDHDPHGADPHVWSSTKNAKKFSLNMLEAILKIDPENSDYYKENYANLVKQIEDTELVLNEMLDDIPSRSFIIYHPALSYFAHDYNLEQHSIEFEGKNPSPAQMKELVDLARRENIKAVLIQQEFDIKNTNVIAQEIGAKAYVINPLAYDWNEEMIRLGKILSCSE